MNIFKLSIPIKQTIYFHVFCNFKNGCAIHCKNINIHLTKLQSEATWKKIVQAAKIRNYKPVLDIVESREMNPPVDFSYHRDCYQVFTMKTMLDRLQKKSNWQKEKEERNMKTLQSYLNSSESYLTSSTQTRGSLEAPCSSVANILPDLCIICNKKVKYVKRKPESLRRCGMKTTQDSLKSFAEQINDKCCHYYQHVNFALQKQSIIQHVIKNIPVLKIKS